MTKPTLIYVYDPMCSWCWGYRPTWQQLQEQLKDKVEIKYCVGGLAPDSDVPMPDDMQQFLQQTWRKISAQLGTEFNFDFWIKCQPRRSTYPACRAAIVAREYGRESAMYLAIQQGYYQQAKNPSDLDMLVECAESIGLDRDVFQQAMQSDETERQLMTDINAARSLPINGFPSLALAHNGQVVPIALDYKNWETSADQINNYL